MSVKLTDAQLVMMSAAVQREDRCLAAPEAMKGAVVSKAWRRDETGRSFALKLTAAGAPSL